MKNKLFIPASFVLVFLTGGASLFQSGGTEFSEYEISRGSTRFLASVHQEDAFLPAKRQLEEAFSSNDTKTFQESKKAFIQVVQARDWLKIDPTTTRRLDYDEKVMGFVNALDKDLSASEVNAVARRESSFWLGLSALLAILGFCANVFLNFLQKVKLRKSIEKVWLHDDNLTLFDQVEALTRYCLYLEHRKKA